MSQIFDSMKGLITPDLIQTASSLLGESNSNVSSAVSKIIPSMLGSFLKKGGSSEVESLMQLAGQKIDIQSGISNIFSGKASAETNQIGSNFLGSLFGNKLNDFTSEISKESGMSMGGTSKLLSMIAPIVAGFLGKQALSGGLSSLLGSLNSDKSSFASMIPSGIMDSMGGTVMDKIKDFFK